MKEMQCAKCGEIFNPEPEENSHWFNELGNECNGVGILIGEW